MAKKTLSKTNIFILILILVVVLGNFLIVTIINEKQMFELSKELEAQAKILYEKKEYKKSMDFYKKALKNYNNLTLYKIFANDDIKRIEQILKTDENFIKLSKGYIYFNGRWVSEDELRALLREKEELINNIHIILKTAKFFEDISSLENDIKVYEDGIKLIDESKFKEDPDIKNLRKQIETKLYDLYIKTGERYLNLGELEKGIRNFEKALAIKDSYELRNKLSNLYIKLAEKLVQQKNYNKALDIVIKAKKLGIRTAEIDKKMKEIVAKLHPEKIGDVEDPSVYFFLSKKAFENKNYQKASAMCEKAVSLGKKEREVFLLCGKSFYHTGEYEKSLQYLSNIPDEDRDVQILKGLNLYKLGKYKEAITYLEKYTDNNEVKEALYRSYKNLGISLIEENPDEAAEYLNKALSLKKDLEIQKLLGDINYGKKSFSKAYTYYQKVLKDPNLRKEVLNKYIRTAKILGDHYFKNNEIRRALSFYLEYLRFKPRDIEILNRVGDIYKKLGNKKAAISYYEKIMNLNKKYFQKNVADKLLNLRLEMGDIYFADGDYEKAIYHYKKALVFSDSERLAEKLAKAYIKMGDRYLKSKNYEKALDYYIKGISLKPSLGVNIEKNLGETYIGVGKILYKRGNYNKAIKYLNKAERFLKGNFDIYYYRGMSHLKLNDTDKVIKDLEKAVNLKSDLYETMLILAKLHLKKGNIDKAERYIDDLIFAKKFLPEVYLLKGDIFLSRGDIENAFKFYIKAEDSGNNSGELYYKIAKIYFKKGNSLKTVSYATKAVKKGFKEKDVFYIRGLSYYKLKDYKNAIKDFTSYIKIDPENPEVYFLRGKLYYEHGDFSKGDYGKAISDIKKAIALGHKEAEEYLKKIETKE